MHLINSLDILQKMTDQKNNIFSIKLVKKNGKLVHKTDAAFGMFMDFVDTLEEGQVVEGFFEAFANNGTNAQLAKIHVCLKQLATDTGNSVSDLKREVKSRCGLCWDTPDGEYCKSFADCSKEELTLVIEEVKQIGDMVGIIF